ncbi:MAG: hypothetical protein IT353_07500 [Gemmatimonadaceae bacterium]|nr:hypothetical protein [Gemmatimonadaceae bacterium]
MRYHSLDVRVGPPSESVRISSREMAAESEIDAVAGIVSIWMSEEAVARFVRAEATLLILTIVFLLRRIAWYHVHGACLIDPRGRGWLFVGNAKGGKSTTTALLVRRGWTLVTDDVGFLDVQSGQATLIGPRQPIELRDGGRELLGLGVGFDVGRGDATGFWPEEFGGSWTDRIKPEIIAFPRLGEHTTISPSTPRQALSAIVKASSLVLLEPAFAQPHLDALGMLARQSRCFDLTIGPDLLVTPQILESLVE